jgi:hypothetical protein
MVGFVAAVTLAGAAIGFVIGEVTLDSGPSGAIASGVVGLLLGLALWSTRRQGQRAAISPERDGQSATGAERSRRPPATGKES